MANFSEDSFNTGCTVRQKAVIAENADNLKLTVKLVVFITSSGCLGLTSFKNGDGFYVKTYCALQRLHKICILVVLFVVVCCYPHTGSSRLIEFVETNQSSQLNTRWSPVSQFPLNGDKCREDVLFLLPWWKFKCGAKEIIVLRARPSQTWLPTKILYTPVQSKSRILQQMCGARDVGIDLFSIRKRGSARQRD